MKAIIFVLIIALTLLGLLKVHDAMLLQLGHRIAQVERIK